MEGNVGWQARGAYIFGWVRGDNDIPIEHAGLSDSKLLSFDKSQCFEFVDYQKNGYGDSSDSEDKDQKRRPVFIEKDQRESEWDFEEVLYCYGEKMPEAGGWGYNWAYNRFFQRVW